MKKKRSSKELHEAVKAEFSKALSDLEFGREPSMRVSVLSPISMKALGWSAGQYALSSYKNRYRYILGEMGRLIPAIKRKGMQAECEWALDDPDPNVLRLEAFRERLQKKDAAKA